MFNIRIISTADTDTTEPFSLQEVKDWLQIDFNEKDDLLTAMSTGARQTVEQVLSLYLLQRIITADIETTCAEIVPLPYAKAVTAVEVSELNDSDEPTTLATG